MGLLDIFKKKTVLDDNTEIKSAFQFLETDYGFTLTKEEIRPDFIAKHFLVYQNTQSKLQVEICGDSSWFHCAFRRLIDGQPARYGDKENCTGFESLAILESDNKYDRSLYHVGGIGLKRVLKNVADLFKRHPGVFTTSNWIDVKRVEQLKGDEFEKKWGHRPGTLSFFEHLKKRAIRLATDNGYTLAGASDELSPFESGGMVAYLMFLKGNKQIDIVQADWRDEYYIYRVKVNGVTVFDVDLRDKDAFTSIDMIMEKMAQHI